MLKCKDISQLVSRSLDTKLSLKERMSIRLHLFMCEQCMRFSQQLSKLNSAINSMNDSVESDTSITLPSEIKKRIVKSLESKD